MQDKKIIKACNFYVSEWHLFAALLPYLRDELKKNNKIFFISQDKLEKGLKELSEKINMKFENKSGIDDIVWITDEYMQEIKNDCSTISIIVQGNTEFIGEINKFLDDDLLAFCKKCTIINCFDIFDTNDMLHNILDEHDFVFNTGGLHLKEDIFSEYKKNDLIGESL